MNAYTLGKDVQQIIDAAQSLDRQLSSLANSGECECPQLQYEEYATLPCVPSTRIEDNFGVSTPIRALSILAQNSQGNYLVEGVCDTPIPDGNGGSTNNIYLGRTELHGLLQLADDLNLLIGAANAQVDLCYGNHRFNNADLPLVYGMRFQWTPAANDFNNANAGLIVFLQAKLSASNNNCNIAVEARSQDQFQGPLTTFRMGNVATIQKLNTVAQAYLRSRVNKIGPMTIAVTNGVLTRLQTV